MGKPNVESETRNGQSQSRRTADRRRTGRSSVEEGHSHRAGRPGRHRCGGLHARNFGKLKRHGRERRRLDQCGHRHLQSNQQHTDLARRQSEQFDHGQPRRWRKTAGQRRRRPCHRRNGDRRQHLADPGLRPGRQRHDRRSTSRTAPCPARTSTAAKATTLCRAAAVPTCSSARPATTRCSARAAADLLFGGADDDVLTGGDGDDQVFGEAGDDRMVWNPGDDTDLNEGGNGIDTVEVNGGNGAEIFTATAERHARALRSRSTRRHSPSTSAPARTWSST